MAENDREHATQEKGAQQVHPDKPAREEGTARGNPNETPPGRPQHEPHDPDEDVAR